METKGYVERAIINELARWDESRSQYTTTEAATQGAILTAIQRLSDSSESSLRVTVTRAFSGLEDKGLVERQRASEDDSDDSRKTWWRLTDDGLAEAAQLERAYNQELADVRRRYGGSWRRTTR